jgi:predicted component of type VI protein secretion system
MPSLAGVAASDINAKAVAEQIRHAISVFEPRLQDVTVTVVPSDGSSGELRYTVHGRVRVAGQSSSVSLETQVSLGHGTVNIQPGQGA